MSAASTADVAQVWPGMDQSFTKEVEDEANSYFQRIYNHPPNPTISIDEVLEMLKKFKDSPVKKERVSTVIPGTIWATVKFLYIYIYIARFCVVNLNKINNDHFFCSLFRIFFSACFAICLKSTDSFLSIQTKSFTQLLACLGE